MENQSELRMLVRLSWPIIVSLLCQGVYGLVDIYYLSILGEEVLSATSLAFVTQGIATAIFTGIATGMNVLISRAIGARNEQKAKETICNGLIAQLVFILIFMAFGLWGLTGYYSSATDNANVIKYGMEYLKPYFIFIFASAMQITFERLLQSSGLSRLSLYSLLIGSIVNIVLDPILIFGLLGFEKHGIAGAAYATIIGQIVAALVALLLNIKYNKVLFSSFRFNFNLRVFGEICLIGIPSSATSIASSIGNYYINKIMISFSLTANAAFGVYAKYQTIAVMPAQGLGAGLITLLSFFYGEKNWERLKKTLVVGAIVLESFGLFCAVLFIFFPHVMISFFNPTEQMYVYGIPCFRMIGTTYLLSCLMFTVYSFLQIIGKSYLTFFITLGRQILVRIPLALLFARFGNPSLIWWCWPSSELSSDLLSSLFFFKSYKKTKKYIEKASLSQPA